jgi:hypothetical protein
MLGTRFRNKPGYPPRGSRGGYSSWSHIVVDYELDDRVVLPKGLE